MKKLIFIIIVAVFYFAQYDSENLENYRSEVIHVEIKGSVNRSGTYTLAYGATMKELIDLAQGFSKLADTSTINLNQTLKDKDVIVVAEVTEIIKVSINSATLEELCTLNGVGPAMAKRIIDYRTTQGSFQTLESIMNVKGIKEKMFEKIKDQICL